MERGVKLNGTEESGLESSKENALAALDAFRADLDAWVAPDVSREVSTFLWFMLVSAWEQLVDPVKL